MGVRLPEQIFRLVDLIGGVHGHQHRPQLHRGPKGNIPLGYVGGPNRHMIPCLYPQGNEGAGKGIHIRPKFRIGTGVVQGGVAEGVLVRENIGDPVQHLGEGEGDEPVLGPGEIAGARPVGIEPGAVPPCPQEALHIVGKVG